VPGVEREQKSVDGLMGCLGSGVDGEAGQPAVEGVTAGEAELGDDGVFEDGAGNVLQHAAVKKGGVWGVEEDGESGRSLFDEEAVGKFLGCAASEGKHGVGVTESGGQGGGFDAAEAGFAMKLKELGDGGTCAVLDMGVEVEEVPADAGGKEASNSGLTRTHKTGENETFKMSGDGRDSGGLSVSQRDGLGRWHFLSLV
jgi:hypothetical protein